MKPYERYVKFVSNVTLTFSDEEMIKIKVVHLDELYNFHVYDFFHMNSFDVSKCCLNLPFLYSNFEWFKQSHIKSFPK